jgi:hypothetical protein
LPAYDEEGIRIILGEMEDISTALRDVTDEYAEYDGNYPDAVKVTVSYYLHCQTRNQRYIQRLVSYAIQ